MTVPEAAWAIVGGSSTFSLSFPEGIDGESVVHWRNRRFATPFGDSPPFTLFERHGKSILTLKMHGWSLGGDRGRASQQVFWVFREAGVQRILAEGGVGSLNRLLRVRDLVIPDDYLDFSMRRAVGLEGQHLLVMRDPLCPELREEILRTAEEEAGVRVFDRGTYAVTDGRHFESPAEGRLLQSWGGDIVGQSLAPEVYLAREIGACYGSIQLVVNRAEGIGEPWEHDELKAVFYEEGLRVGRILLGTLDRLREDRRCSCLVHRRPTLLTAEDPPGSGLQPHRPVV